MKIELNKPFARNGKVDEFDVKQIKKVMNRLGYYTPPADIGITGIPDTAIFNAVKTFQKDQGLAATGEMRPNDDTVQIMNTENKNGGNGQYIWRSTGDSKVRASHAALNGTIRDFSDSPDPGQEPNCRCWAEPLKKKKKKKKLCFDDLPWKDNAMANIRDHEKDIYFPYIDSAAKITIGIGININQKSRFMALPWTTESKTGNKATKEQIESNYQKLQDEINNKEHYKDEKFDIEAEDQEKWTDLYLPDAPRSQLFRNLFRQFQTEINNMFSEFSCFPPDAKIALMDLIYNLGAAKFSKTNWPHLFDAVEKHNWNIAALESHRKPPVPEDRNNTTRDQFIAAERMKKATEEKHEDEDGSEND